MTPSVWQHSKLFDLLAPCDCLRFLPHSQLILIVFLPPSDPTFTLHDSHSVLVGDITVLLFPKRFHTGLIFL